MPTASEEMSSANFGTVNKLSVAHKIGEKTSLGYNIGYNYFGTGNGDLGFSLAAGFGITDKLGFYAEPYGEMVNFDKLSANFDTGFTYLAKENFQLDISYGFGINETMNYLSVGFQLEYRPEKGRKNILFY